MTIHRPRFPLRHAVTTSNRSGCRPAFDVTAALVLTGVVAPCASAAATTPVPANIQALVAPGDSVLAFRPAKPFGADAAGGAMIVRHAEPDPLTGNSCELWLLSAAGATYTVTSKNGEVIDCRYNASSKNAEPMELTRNLAVAPTSVTYFNELPRGGTAYEFVWSGQKHEWHLQHVEATSVENGKSGVIVSKSVLDYPDGLPWLTMVTFSPKVIRESLLAHRTKVQ